jgi:hypothetical protein
VLLESLYLGKLSFVFRAAAERGKLRHNKEEFLKTQWRTMEDVVEVLIENVVEVPMEDAVEVPIEDVVEVPMEDVVEVRMDEAGVEAEPNVMHPEEEKVASVPIDVIYPEEEAGLALGMTIWTILPCSQFPSQMSELNVTVNSFFFAFFVYSTRLQDPVGSHSTFCALIYRGKK